MNIKKKIALKKFKRKLRSKEKKLKKNRFISGYISHETLKPRAVRITAPESICLYKRTYLKVIKFIERLRFLTLHEKKTVVINFNKTNRMESSATLMLIAEIERIQELTNKGRIKGNLPKDKVASQVFCKTGLSELLNIKHTVEAEHETVTYWNKYLTGIDGTVIEAAQELERIKLKTKYRKAFFTGISEAITNITMHAYDKIDTRDDGYKFVEHKWWMFTGCDDKQMTLVICDIGKGIPVALRGREDFTILSKAMELLTGGKDSKAIKTAMEIGKTSSNLSHRGKGMAQLKQAIDVMNAGSLVINSNKGLYIYNADGDEKFSKDLKLSIKGTIVTWSAPLDRLQKMIRDEQEIN